MALDDLQPKRKKPFERGVDAGKQAYFGTPKRSGVGAINVPAVQSSVERAIQQSAAQRQALADVAAKQARGDYGNTGTSAAAYDYLRGRGEYPVKPIIGGTVQQPYEQSNPVGPITQKTISDKAQTVTDKKIADYQRPGPSEAMLAKPGPLSRLLEYATPAYLGYKAYNWLMGPTADAAYTGLGKLVSPGSFFGGAPVYDIPLQSYPELSSGIQGLLNYDSGVTLASAAAPGADIALQEALSRNAANIAAASTPAVDFSSYGSWDVPGATAGAEAGSFLSTAAPYLAGALVLDKLTGGAVGKAGQDVIDFTKKAGQDILDTGVQAVKDLGSGAKNVVNTVLRPFGIRLAEGGVADLPETSENLTASGGIAALPQSTDDSPLVPRFTASNALGKLVDADLVSAYQTATKTGNKSKARALKTEIDYRKRGPTVQSTPIAAGGISTLGGYSDGGRLLKGPGDGVSDSIPATIGAKRQPARLADGEFVVPARIVSELGNGSTEAGARKLYAMMDRIQSARKKSVGKGKVAVNSRAEKYLPK